MLQAARALTLGLPLESSFSWGLNRATFIAAAKRGFKGGSGTGGGREGGGSSEREGTYMLGDDTAYTTKRKGVLLFTFGGKVQTREEFDKRVKARFGGTFDDAWNEALTYVKGFDKQTLLSSEVFFRDVYRPVRDVLAEKWTNATETSSE